MRALSKVFVCAVLTVVPSACGSGGSSLGSLGGANASGLKAADLSGNWDLTLERTAASCSGPVLGERETIRVAIAVNGTQVAISQPGKTDTVLNIVGSRVQGTTVDVLGASKVTGTIDFGLVAGRIVGTQNLVEVATATNQEICKQSFTISGEKAVGAPMPSPSASKFNGTWNLVGTISSVVGSQCDPTILVGNVDSDEVIIAVTGNTATLTGTAQDVTQLTVENGRLKATLTDTDGSVTTVKQIDFGIVDETTFNGTVTFTTRDGVSVICTVTQDILATRL